MHSTTNSIIVKILRFFFKKILHVSGTVKLTPKHSKKIKKSFSMLILFDYNSIIRSGINN